MADQQAGSNPSENQSYDADMLADVRGAFEEVSKGETVADDKAPEPKAEPVKTEAAPEKVTEKVVTEPKADHPTDEKRYADGTFKPTKEETEAAKVAPVKTEQPVKVDAPPAVNVNQQQPASAINPPGGFSPKTKAEWEKITAAYPHLAADIAKREQEIAAGFAQYEGMRELRPYMDMARSQGQSLKQALDNYTGIEAALRNPQQALGVLLHLAGNAGYPPQRLAMELAPYLGSPTGQQGAPQGQGAQPPIDPSMFQQWLNPLAQEVNSLKSLFQQQSEAAKAREFTAIGTVLERFKSDTSHRYYENVEPQMTQLLERGIVPRTGDYATDLQAAYDMACRLNPEISELLLNERTAKSEAAKAAAEKETAEKARQASRSITGSPSGGSVKDGSDSGGDSVEDDVRRAVRAHAA